ncbi:MAG: hypothetical protein QOI34_907 [Verrucomicrobiota bacterium]
MTRSATRFRVFGLALHLTLVVLVCSHETFSVLAQGLTISPRGLNRFWDKATRLTASTLGLSLPASNPFRAIMLSYLECSGIESGYGYFAPNVPDSCKLVFELHYTDGTIGYELPSVNSSAAGLRLVTFLEKLVRPESDPFRKFVIKTMVSSVWHEHPDATRIRAVLGTIKLPGPTEFEKGQRNEDEVLFAYEFDRTEPFESTKP